MFSLIINLYFKNIGMCSECYSSNAMEIKNAEYAGKKHTHTHIFYIVSCLSEASECYSIKKTGPPLVRHHQPTGSSISTKHWGEWRRLTVSYIVAAPLIRMSRFFHFHLDFCQSSGFLHCWQHYIAQMRGRILACVLWLVLQIIWLYQPDKHTHISVRISVTRNVKKKDLC